MGCVGRIEVQRFVFLESAQLNTIVMRKKTKSNRIWTYLSTFVTSLGFGALFMQVSLTTLLEQPYWPGFLLSTCLSWQSLDARPLGENEQEPQCTFINQLPSPYPLSVPFCPINEGVNDPL